MLTLESMSQSADEDFILIDYVHQLHVDSSIFYWWIYRYWNQFDMQVHNNSE